jgi:hypothetical protein
MNRFFYAAHRVMHRMAEFALKVLILRDINEAQGQALKILVEESREQLGNAENFVVITVHHAETNERYTITIQRDGKLNPATKWLIAEEKIARLESQLDMLNRYLESIPLSERTLKP